VPRDWTQIAGGSSSSVVPFVVILESSRWLLYNF
jgi:hypothetical protein